MKYMMEYTQRESPPTHVENGSLRSFFLGLLPHAAAVRLRLRPRLRSFRSFRSLRPIRLLRPSPRGPLRRLDAIIPELRRDRNDREEREPDPESPQEQAGEDRRTEHRGGDQVEVRLGGVGGGVAGEEVGGDDALRADDRSGERPAGLSPDQERFQGLTSSMRA